LGLKDGLRGPTGFNPGHGVALLFDRAAYGYSGMKTFDDMRFRSLRGYGSRDRQPRSSSGRLLAHGPARHHGGSGSLYSVELNNKILVDGGMVDNSFRCSRDMGAKIVIVVDVASDSVSRKELSTLGGVIDQALDIATLENERRGLKLANVVVKPELRKFSSGRFL